MNTLSFNAQGLSASTPSAGLWQRAANLYWTGWSQYAASMNQDTRLRPAFPLWSRQAQGDGEEDASSPGAPVTGAIRSGRSRQQALADDFLRLIDRAA
jgi:hypothetical protein